MAAVTKPFTLYQRSRKNKKSVYYVQFRLSDGSRATGQSTGKTTKGAAETWAINYLKNNDLTSQEPTLYEYAKDFFDWGKCNWIKRQNAKDRSFVKGTATDRRNHLVNYLFPAWGNVKLKDFNGPAVEKWLLDLKSVKKVKGEFKNLSNSTKNQIIYTLNIIFKEAKRERLIDYRPDIESFGTKRQKHRQPLTDQEMNLLFPFDRTEFINIWYEFEIGVMFETMLSTGARSGEARGWWKSDIMVEAKAIKIFRQLYNDDSYGLPGRVRNPDKDTRRIALLPERTLNDIIEVIGAPPYPDEPLFTYAGKPIAKDYILKRLKRAAKSAGIKRDIDVHTLRFAYTSKMRELMISADIPDSILQNILGHSTPKVTDIYDPFMLERAITKSLPSRPAVDNFWKLEPPIQEVI